MRAWLCIALVAATVFNFSSSANASPCTRGEQDKADYLAQPLVQKVIAKNGNGSDIRSRISYCDFNTYSKQFKVVVDLDWHGAVVRSNAYWMSGELTFDSTGGAGRFAEISASKTLKDYRSSIFWAGVAVMVLDSSNTPTKPAKPSVAPENYDPLEKIFVVNRCGHASIVYLSWLDTGNHWRYANWKIPAGARSGLLTGRDHVLTRNNIIYVMAERPDGYRFIEGKLKLAGANAAHRYLKLNLEDRPRTVNLC